jgi:hypothetical protein
VTAEFGKERGLLRGRQDGLKVKVDLKCEEASDLEI